MKYGSVCSGIEAATAAWHPLGWQASFFSEIEPFQRAVLAHHYPNIPLHGDFTTIKGSEYEPIDLLVGGTPCQSFSIAGLRGGLDDDRGNLALEFLRLADRTRPKWLVWENVPGVLSSNGGRDFGSILGGMVELGYGVAYRVLDAQYFGVAQRRRRVFVVGYLGDWTRAAAVLFERHSLQGHSAPRREARESVAGTLGGSSQSGGFRTTDLDNSGAFIPVQANTLMSFGHSPNPLDETLVAQTVAPSLTSNPYGDHESREGTLVAFGGNRTSGPIDVTPALLAQPGSGVKCDFESETFIKTGLAHQHGGSIGPHTFAVRRLTPRECERLQGFPDDYTLVPNRGKPAADGPRYKALGNSMAVPVMRWIGQRISASERRHAA
jgi:DNA (cytosine-5)-methyltransferase 1